MFFFSENRTSFDALNWTRYSQITLIHPGKHTVEFMSFRRGSLSIALELEVVGIPLVFDLSFYLYTFLKHFISPTQERLISFHAFQEWYEGHSLTISFCDENSQELNEKTRKLWKGCGKAKPWNSGKFNWESSWQTLHFVWVLNETTYVFQFQYPRLLIIWSPTL